MTGIVSKMSSKLFPNGTSFINSFSFEERLEEANRALEKYPNRIPIIIEPGTKTVIDISRKKYLVPYEISVGQFMHIIRQRMKLDPSEAIFLFCNGKLAPTSKILSEIYETDQNNDKFLYFKYCNESTFG